MRSEFDLPPAPAQSNVDLFTSTPLQAFGLVINSPGTCRVVVPVLPTVLLLGSGLIPLAWARRRKLLEEITAPPPADCQRPGEPAADRPTRATV